MATQDTYESPLVGRNASREMLSLFSPQKKFGLWRRLWLELARCEKQLGLTRISLRSKTNKVNVSEICGQFGGGGHPAAAGARISGTPMSVQRKVIGAIKKALKAAK